MDIWIMEGRLERDGFQIDQADYQDDFLASYICTKRPATVPAASLTVAGQQLH